MNTDMPNPSADKSTKELEKARIEEDLVKQIIASSVDNVASTVLRTDERVIARVTDGIYRQPASTIRELINNAYDADATRVVIKTDAPRFEKISIEDDGNGMSPETLAHMLLHIGGSAKRHEVGKDLGITSANNPLFSPNGRRLIGKIGIGIFSVAQLTHNFQIITKTRGADFRTVATVALKQYSDDGTTEKPESDDTYESGRVNIWREKASDLESHGTTIVLTRIRPQARDTLRSRSIWSAIEESEKSLAMDEYSSFEPPLYHVGRVDSSGELLVRTNDVTSNVPWEHGDNAEIAFHKLVECVWSEIQQSNLNPRLEKLFDYYLQMIWAISLSIPLPYVEGHLFDMDLAGWAEAFLIKNQTKGLASEIPLQKGTAIREILNLEEGKEPVDFEVYFDELKLSRPIKYKGLPQSGHAIKNPLVFIGKCREEFSGVSSDISGGPLDFEAYLFWTPKVAPTEHRGSLIRINGASGTLFDPSFMRYQVNELTRLRQITCEIFVHQGFDSALNIDRESFNYAHPHAVYLTRWLHNALKQLATAQKRLAYAIRGSEKERAKTENLGRLQQIAQEVWHHENDEDSSPPTIAIGEVQSTIEEQQADIVFSRSAIMPMKQERQTIDAKNQAAVTDEKIKAIAQVLASFGLLENLSKTKQERLLNAIYQILETPIQ